MFTLILAIFMNFFYIKNEGQPNCIRFWRHFVWFCFFLCKFCFHYLIIIWVIVRFNWSLCNLPMRIVSFFICGNHSNHGTKMITLNWSYLLKRKRNFIEMAHTLNSQFICFIFNISKFYLSWRWVSTYEYICTLPNE